MNKEEKFEQYQTFCADIFVTAIEGGIDYWLDTVTEYQWDCMPEYVQAKISWAHYPDDGDSYYESKLVTWEVINDGIKKLLEDVDPTTIFGWKEYLLKAVVTNDAGMLDANDADSIFQHGLFDRAMFG